MTQLILLLLAFITVAFCSVAFYFEKTGLKFVAITALVILASFVYFSLDGVKGWPAEEPFTIEGKLATVVIINPTNDDPGAIYIGVFLKNDPEWYEYDYHREAPKTFFVEYSNNRAAEFQQAKEAMEEGKEVHISGIPPKEALKGKGEEGATEESDSVLQMLGNAVKRLISKQKDTYQPNVPNELEIIDQNVPPEKGTN